MMVRRFAMPMLLAAVLALLAAVPGPSLKDPMPRIGLAAAFGAELDPLLAALTVTRAVVAGGAEYVTGRLGDREVVLIKAGPGMVNAAARIQHAADHFTLTHLIFSGVAGGLDPELPLGAVVVPQRWINHQFGAIMEAGAAPLTLNVHPFGGTPVALDGFDIDAALFEIAQTIPDIVPGGTGVSGDLFVDSAAERRRLSERFGARIVDMESAAAAQVALLNGIPFIAVRAISDEAAGSALAQITANVQAAAESAAAAALSLVQRMP